MKIYSEISLPYFNFWSGGKQNAELLTFKELEQIESCLEDLYPDGIDETMVNDIFWFDTDFIAECLGFDSWEELYESRT